jgi:hypothetical protein
MEPKFSVIDVIVLGPGSSVGVATGYGLDGPGIESRWGGARFSAPIETGPGTHPASCTMGTGSFPGVKSGRGVTLTPPPSLLVPLVMKEKSYTSAPPMGRTACTELQCLYKGALYLTLFRSPITKPVKYPYSSYLSLDDQCNNWIILPKCKSL